MQMADKGRPEEWQTKDPKHKCYNGKISPSAALHLPQEREQEWNAAEEGVREDIQIRLEYPTVALHQVLPFVSINSTALNEILGNRLRVVQRKQPQGCSKKTLQGLCSLSHVVSIVHAKDVYFPAFHSAPRHRHRRKAKPAGEQP